MRTKMNKKFIAACIVVCLIAPVMAVCIPHAGSCGQENPEVAGRHYRNGNLYFEQGDYTQAQEEFQRALQALGKLTIVQEEKVVKTKSVTISSPENSGAGGSAQPGTSVTHQSTETQQTKTTVYVIDKGDILGIKVWENSDLDQEAEVRNDGMISLSLLGDIPAAGKTIPELGSDITGGLTEYIKSPKVFVSLKKIGNKKIIILGEVARPGIYYLNGANNTVLEAVGTAGGFSPSAVLSSVILIHGGFQNPKGQRLNMNRFLLKAGKGQNVLLQPEDIIYVPKNFIANVNYFVSQIVAPIAQGVTTASVLDTTRR